MRNIAAFSILLLSACSDGSDLPSLGNVSVMAHQCAAMQLRCYDGLAEYNIKYAPLNKYIYA